MFLLFGCGSLFLYPSKQFYPIPKEVYSRFSQVELNDSDGPKLIVWKFKSKKEKGVVVFLHGNAGNLSTQFSIPFWLSENAYTTYALDYRGFGGSEGVDSVAGSYEDAKRLIRYVESENRDSELIFYGQSFGATLALSLSCNPELRSKFKKIVADSGFSSFSGIIKDKLAERWLSAPLFPLAYFFSDKFSPDVCLSNSNLSDVSSNSYILLHSESDDTVPFKHAKRIKEILGEKSRLIISKNQPHNSVLNDPIVQDELLKALAGKSLL
ncbi:MAG: alpha/beta hydrolase [Bdellovibrionales bacterium]|nr:alpha/beta hydrolase [Bdellovibrionales bacterium]